MTETPGRGAGHPREEGRQTNSRLLDEKCQKETRGRSRRSPSRCPSLGVGHSGVSEKATELPDSAPAGTTDVKTRGEKERVMGKLPAPECPGQAHAVAAKEPGAAGRSRPRPTRIPARLRALRPCPTHGGGGNAQSPQHPAPPAAAAPRLPDPRGAAGARAASPHSPRGSIPRPGRQTNTHDRRALSRLELDGPILPPPPRLARGRRVELQSPLPLSLQPPPRPRQPRAPRPHLASRPAHASYPAHALRFTPSAARLLEPSPLASAPRRRGHCCGRGGGGAIKQVREVGVGKEGSLPQQESLT